MSSGLRAIFACLLVVLATPGGATAATVSIESSGSYAGGVFVSSFNADADDITVSVLSPTQIRVQDANLHLSESVAECSGTAAQIDCTVTAMKATVFVGDGDDEVVVVGAIQSSIDGGPGVDDVRGGSLNDEISGGSGVDFERGGAGNDLLYNTGGGNDTLDGEEGSDILYAGTGADDFVDTGATGTDAVTYFFEAAGVRVSVDDSVANDGLSGGAEGDEVRTGIEKLQGTNGFGDILIGGPGADTINGSGGDDDITGGGGADVLEGNVGNDTIRARDSAADTTVACDSPSDNPPNSGPDELAETDANDPAVAGCEREDRTGGGTGGGGGGGGEGGGGGTTPTTPPGSTTPDGALNFDLGGCPSGGELFLRPDVKAADLRAGKLRVLVDVPQGGWLAGTRVLTLDRPDIALGPAAFAGTTGHQTLELKPTIDGDVADGQKVSVSVTVLAPGRPCPGLVLEDELQLDGAPDGSGESRSAARLRAGQPVEVRPCGPGKLTPEEYTRITVGTLQCIWQTEPPPPPACEKLFQVSAKIQITGACIKRDPKTGVLESNAKIDLNGIEITPGGSLAVDPATASLKMNGAVKIAIPTIDRGTRTGEVVLYEGSGFSLSLAGDEFTLLDSKTSSKAKLGGFPVVGKASFKLTLGGGTVDLRFGLPKKFAGVSKLQGGALVKFGPNGIELTDAVLKLPEVVELGRLKLKAKGVALGGELRYKKREGKATWAGKLHAELPSPPVGEPPALDMEVEFTDGAFTKGSMEITNINKPFGHPAVFLQRLKAGLELDPALKILGGIGVSFGPKLAKLRLAEADIETLSYTFSDPGVWEGNGSITALGGSKAQGHIRYSTDGKLDFDGDVKVNYLVASIDGDWKGSVLLGGGFHASGKATLTIPLFTSITGGLQATEKALSVCGSVGEVELGMTVTYTRPAAPEMLQGCGLASWGTGKSRSVARASATTAASTKLPAGLPKAAFSATGTTGPPNVVLVGPDNRRISVPTTSGGAAAFFNLGDKTTYFVVNKPAAGTWSLEVQDGSSPVASTRVAEGVDPPKIEASVTGSGDRRTLRYDVDGPEGTKVTFLEEGKGAGSEIATVGRGSGTASFRPADGDAGRRSIIATAEQDGLPAGTKTVASFRVGSPPAAGALPCFSGKRNPFKRESRITIGGVDECARLKIKLDGDDVIVSWNAAKNASGYRVIAKSSGRRQVVLTDANGRSSRVRGIGADDGAAIQVVALNEDGKAGPDADILIRPSKIKPRVKKRFPDNGVLGIAEITAG